MNARKYAPLLAPLAVGVFVGVQITGMSAEQAQAVEPAVSGVVQGITVAADAEWTINIPEVITLQEQQVREAALETLATLPGVEGVEIVWNDPTLAENGAAGLVWLDDATEILIASAVISTHPEVDVASVVKHEVGHIYQSRAGERLATEDIEHQADCVGVALGSVQVFYQTFDCAPYAEAVAALLG